MSVPNHATAHYRWHQELFEGTLVVRDLDIANCRLGEDLKIPGQNVLREVVKDLSVVQWVHAVFLFLDQLPISGGTRHGLHVPVLHLSNTYLKDHPHHRCYPLNRAIEAVTSHC